MKSYTDICFHNYKNNNNIHNTIYDCVKIFMCPSIHGWVPVQRCPVKNVDTRLLGIFCGSAVPRSSIMIPFDSQCRSSVFETGKRRRRRRRNKRRTESPDGEEGLRVAGGQEPISRALTRLTQVCERTCLREASRSRDESRRRTNGNRDHYQVDI